MRKVLTDTHTLVWALSMPEELSHRARRTLDQSETWASAANLWELITKRNKQGRLLDDPLGWWERYVVHSGISILAIQTRHVAQLSRLPDLHKDPFDRILISQAQIEDMTLVSKDEVLESYGIAVAW